MIESELCIKWLVMHVGGGLYKLHKNNLQMFRTVCVDNNAMQCKSCICMIQIFVYDDTTENTTVLFYVVMKQCVVMKLCSVGMF